MTKGILRQITELQNLSAEELKERWKELFDFEPPTSNRAQLVRRLAYRIQELAYGGVSEATRARLSAHLKEHGLDVEVAGTAGTERRKRKDGMPVIGTRLIREWNGARYEVTVVRGGFEYAGCRYRSLTSVSKAITGTHWNGPAFFGLRKPNKERR